MRIAGLAKVITILSVVAMLMSFNGRLHFMFDNLSSFKVQFAMALLSCSVIFLVVRQRQWLVVALIGLAINLGSILPWYIPPAESASLDDHTAITVLLSNVSRRNTDYEQLAKLLDEEQPDLFGLVEIDAAWLDNLDHLTARYPYRFEAPDEGYWGLAVYSQLPLSDARLINFGEEATPAIVAKMIAISGEVELILAHLRPPMDTKQAASRNAQLSEMAHYIRETDKPVLLVADLNTAMWSGYYRDFVEMTALKNARAGYGVGSTWPPLRVFGVPIDHIMSSDSITLGDFRVLPSIGSDHLPIVADVRFHSRNPGLLSGTGVVDSAKEGKGN